MSELYDRGFLRSLILENTTYMLVAGSGLSDELDTEGGLVRVRLIVVSRLIFGTTVCGESARIFTGYDMSKLVGSCGFPSHETTSDTLCKYCIVEELALIRTLGTGEQAYTYPIVPLWANRVIEGPVKSKEDLDNLADRFAEDVTPCRSVVRRD
jgi:hypothetical protein